MSRWIAGALVLLVAAGASIWWWRSREPVTEPKPQPAASLPQPCREMAFEAVNYIVCEVDLNEYDLVLRRTDASGNPYGNLSALAKVEPFVFATNAGMYHEDLGPVGLYLEDGREMSPLNLGDAPGNFFMKPNGVFYVDRAGHAGVVESGTFVASGIKPALATQSGPMLVIDGSLHPRFEQDGASRYIRNGVGTNGGKQVIFAISRQPVSLGSFARLFRDELGIRNALFFDGAISALHDGSKYLVGGSHPTGPILAVREKPAGTAQ